MIPITTGRSGKGSEAVCTRIGQLSKSISRFGARKFFEIGAKVRRSIISNTLRSAALKAAASRWPTLLLTLGDAQRDRALDAPEGLRYGVALDAVAHDGAGRVRFDVVEVLRPQSRPRAHAVRISSTCECRVGAVM